MEIVKGIFWEVRRDGRRVFLCYRGHQNRLSEEELEIDGERGCVVGVDVPERVQNGCTISMSLVERCVEVIHKTVTESPSDIYFGHCESWDVTYRISRTFLAACATEGHR